MEKIRTHRLPRRRAKREKPCFPKLRSQYGATHSFRFSLRALFNFWFFALSFVALVGCVALALVFFNFLEVDLAKPFDAVYEYDENAEITKPVETNGAANGVTVSALRRVDGGDIVVLAEEEPYIALHEHIWVEDKNPVVVDPTCTTNGSYTYTDTCSVSGCKEKRIRVVTVNAVHITETTTEVIVPQSCTTAETYVVIKTCRDCGTVVSRDPVVNESKPALNHKNTTNHVTTVPAEGCTKAGSKTTTTVCNLCNETISITVEIIPAKHAATSKRYEDVVDATCVLPGSFVLVEYCSKCGVEFSRAQNYTPATGHHYVYCTDTECRDCGAAITPKDHTLIDKNAKPVVEATCTEDGYRDYYAEYCTDEHCQYRSDITREVIPATGHSFTDNCDATCNNAGCSFKRPFEELHNFEFDCSPKCTDCGVQNPREYHVTSGAHSCAQAVVCLVCKTEVYPALEHTRLNCRDQICSVCGQICDPIKHVDTNGDYYCDVFTCMEHLRHIPVGRLIAFIFLIIFALGAVASLGWALYMTFLFFYRSFMVPTMRLEFYEDVMVMKWGVFFKRHIEKRFIGVYDVLSMPRNRYFYRDRREKKKPAKYGTVLAKVPGGGYEWNLKFYGVKHYIQLHNYLKSKQVNESIESTQIVGKIDFNK